jgi:hypothetical protein
MPEQKIATAADFRNAIKDEDCYEPARQVFLPKCEKWVLLRKPKPLAYTLLGAPLPGLKEAVDGEHPGPEEAREELLRIASWSAKLLNKIFASPKLSLRPGPDEIHPSWLSDEDQNFIFRWCRGEVDDSGASLSTFPGRVQE